MLYTRARLRELIEDWVLVEASAEELADLDLGLRGIDPAEARVAQAVLLGYSFREISRLLKLGSGPSPARRLYERALEHLEGVLNG